MRHLTRNGGIAILTAIGLILWGNFSDRFGPVLIFWSAAVVIPMAIGGIGGLIFRGSIGERLAFTVIPPVLYGAFFLWKAMSPASDSDAPSLLVAYVLYWAVVGGVCLLGITAIRWALRAK